jgi:uncharacterized protein YjbJ (UPF0337 family)
MDDQVAGVARQGLGRVQDGLGGLTGDGQTQAKGKLNEAAGAVQQVFGQIKGGAKDAFEDALQKTRAEVHDRLDQVEGYVQQKPLPALAIAAAAGLVIGLLLRGRSQTIYLRER